MPGSALPQFPHRVALENNSLSGSYVTRVGCKEKGGLGEGLRTAEEGGKKGMKDGRPFKAELSN